MLCPAWAEPDGPALTQRLWGLIHLPSASIKGLRKHEMTKAEKECMASGFESETNSLHVRSILLLGVFQGPLTPTVGTNVHYPYFFGWRRKWALRSEGERGTPRGTAGLNMSLSLRCSLSRHLDPAEETPTV